MNILFLTDGNRRWARKQGEGPEFGYDAMATTIASICDSLYERGIDRLYIVTNTTKTY